MKKKTIIVIAVTGVLAAAAAVSVFWFGKEKRRKRQRIQPWKLCFTGWQRRDHRKLSVCQYTEPNPVHGTASGAVLQTNREKIWPSGSWRTVML